MRRLQAPAGHEPGIDQHQDRAFCPAIRETSTYAQMCAAAQPLCGRVETVWVQPQSFDDGRQPESRSSQLTGGPQSIDWGTGWSIWTSDLQTPQQCLVHWVACRGRAALARPLRLEVPFFLLRIADMGCLHWLKRPFNGL